jgi:hypothetical protein
MNTKSTGLSIGALFLCLALCLCAAPVARASDTVAFTNTSVNGTITCSSSVQLGAGISATGKISVVADGNGKLTSGTASYQASSEIACYYALASGTYTVRSNGTGLATTTWSLSKGSSPNCKPTVSQTGISFSLANSTFVSPTAAGRSESGNCTLANSTATSQ